MSPLPPPSPHTGADPMADLLKLADEMRFTKKFEKVSLGQGQGPKAEKLLEAGMDRGMWVCLQNCHLAVSWMPSLERIVDGIQPDKVHKVGGMSRVGWTAFCSCWVPKVIPKRVKGPTTAPRPA